MYFKIGKSVDRYNLPTSITHMKSTITYTYMIASLVAIILLHNGLKDTSEALENTQIILDYHQEALEHTQSILDYHQKALESHKAVIKSHDGALGRLWNYFFNTQV